MRHMLFAAAVTAAFAAPAGATTTFTFQRISDTEAVMTASGSPDTGFSTGLNIGRFNKLDFTFLVEGFSGGAEESGNFTFGGNALGGYAADGGSLLSNDAQFFDDAVATGRSVLTLVGSVAWAPIGAGNQVLSNFESQKAEAGTSQTNIQIGVWEMVAPIPLPAGAWLLLAGFGALGALSRKRRAA